MLAAKGLNVKNNASKGKILRIGFRVLLCVLLVFSLFVFVVLSIIAMPALSRLAGFSKLGGGQKLVDSGALAGKSFAAEYGGPGSSLIRGTKKIIEEQVQRFIYWRMQSEFLRTKLNHSEILIRFEDETMPIATRRLDAWRLAVMDTREGFEALKRALLSGNAQLRAAVAEALGHSTNREARNILLSLLNDSDEIVICGAIKGLSMFDDDETARILSDILSDGNYSEQVRAEAAYALGRIETDASLNGLASAYETDCGTDMKSAILSSLGNFPFEKTETIFRDALTSDAIPGETKVEAVESLADSDRDAIPFLVEVASGSSDSEIRESAAWTIGASRNTGDFASDLSRLIKCEVEPDVRRRLYESVSMQNKIPGRDIFEMASAETDIAAFVAGSHAVAINLRQNDGGELSSDFDELMLPKLFETAVSDNSLNLRLRSVFALRMAGTEASLSALRTIAQVKDQRVAGAAARAVAAHVRKL